jgi:ribosomal protein S18 acetylase RimI-like enzyme
VEWWLINSCRHVGPCPNWNIAAPTTVSDLPGVWNDTYAYVGYKEGRAVTASVAVPVGGCLYVGWVATHPDVRRQGFAEAAMRRSLNEATQGTGYSRTVLHASEMGRPLYEAMGYREVAFFDVYFPEALVSATPVAQ